MNEIKRFCTLHDVLVGCNALAEDGTLNRAILNQGWEFELDVPHLRGDQVGVNIDVHIFTPVYMEKGYHREQWDILHRESGPWLEPPFILTKLLLCAG